MYYHKVYVCSPYKGDTENNVERAREYCRQVIAKGYIPIAPHIYFTQFMNDNNYAERLKALDMNTELLKECSELWVFSDTVSDGMKAEIKQAHIYNIPIFFVNKGTYYKTPEKGRLYYV